MPYSYPRHFWTWFLHNSDTLLRAHKSTKKEEEYWLREIDTHLRAYTKKLAFSILWNDNGASRFVITASANPRYFNMAEKLAAKAPSLPGWEIIGLYPVNLMPQKLLEHIAGEAGLDFHKCWFTLPGERTSGGRAILNVYAEVYTDITAQMCNVISCILNNLLGERTRGIEIDYAVVDSIFNRSAAEKKKELIPLQELPSYIISRDLSTIIIDEKGSLLNI